METVIWTNWFFCAVFPPEFSILKRTWEQELLSFLFSLFLNALFILYFFKTASFISLYKSALFIFLFFSLFCPIFAFDLIFWGKESRKKSLLEDVVLCSLPFPLPPAKNLKSIQGPADDESSKSWRKKIKIKPYHKIPFDSTFNNS